MRVDVYYRILVDAKAPWGLLKPSLKRHYQWTLMWRGCWEVEGACRKRKRRKRSPWNGEQKEGRNRASTSGLPQQNICATSGKILWNLRVPSFHFTRFFLLLFTSSSSCSLHLQSLLTPVRQPRKYSCSNARWEPFADFIAGHNWAHVTNSPICAG